MKVNSEREVTQSCPTLSDPMDDSLPGSSIHGIFQARVLEWGAILLLNPYTEFLIPNILFFFSSHSLCLNISSYVSWPFGFVFIQVFCLFYVLLNIDSFCCCCSVAQSYLILCTSMDCRLQASLSFTIAHSLLKLMSVKSVTPSNHLILCHPLLLPSIFPGIRVFSNKSVLHIR